MAQEEAKFRTSMGGFNKQDVIAYISTLQEENVLLANRVIELQKNAPVASAGPEQAYMLAQKEQELSEKTAQVEALQAQVAKLEAELAKANSEEEIAQRKSAQQMMVTALNCSDLYIKSALDTAQKISAATQNGMVVAGDGVQAGIDKVIALREEFDATMADLLRKLTVMQDDFDTVRRAMANNKDAETAFMRLRRENQQLQETINSTAITEE